MELLIKCLLLFIWVPCVHSTITLGRSTVEGAWNQFKLRYNVIPAEDFERRDAFKESLRYVVVKNIAHELTGDEYLAGLNCASKLTPRERICSLSKKKKAVGLENMPSEPIEGNCFCLKDIICPRSINWVAKKKVFTPGCQDCGDCYAWAATYALSSALAIHNKRSAIELSVQEAKDCSYHVYYQTATNESFNKGCDGGDVEIVYDGLKTQTQYTMANGNKYAPYNNQNGTLVCDTALATSNIEVTMRNHETLYNVSDCDLKKQLQKGPVAATMCISKAAGLWISKKKAMYQDLTCYTTCQHEMNTTLNTTELPPVNHAVLIVGYTKTTWIIQNSYGTNWGTKGVGHFTRQRFNGTRICNLAYRIYWPVL